MISVIIPTYNEEGRIEQAIASVLAYRDEAEIEIIVADGGSSDATVSLARANAKVVSTETGRARQLNAAAEEAGGDIFFFLHAHVTLPSGALTRIDRAINAEGKDGGGFSNVFSEHNQKIKRLGRLLNLRLRDNDHSGNTLFFGDNGIFVRREVFEALGGFKTMPIMEDYDFSKRMRERFEVVRISDPKLIVSSRRHVKAGFVRTRIQWILTRQLYQLGVSPDILARWYPKVR
jgi:rSAM/selenodomain-associated transferase 2